MITPAKRKTLTHAFLLMTATWNPQVSKVGGPFDSKGAIPASGSWGRSRFQEWFAFPKHGGPCSSRSFRSLPCWLVWGYQLVRHSCQARYHHAQGHAAGMVSIPHYLKDHCTHSYCIEWVLMVYYRCSLFTVASVESVLPVSSVNFKRLVFIIFFGGWKGDDEWSHSLTTLYDL